MRRPVALAAAVAVALALLTASAVAHADGLSDLEKAYGAFVAHQYENAEGRLVALLDPKSGTLTDPDIVADARMYLAAVLIAEGRKEDAANILDDLLLANPEYQPDPLRVPLPALDAVVDARFRLRTRLSAIKSDQFHKAKEKKDKEEAERRRVAARLQLLEKLAGEETIIERHSRWVALIPLGVGQFQNGQKALGWTFLASEALLGAGNLIGVGLTLYNESLASDAYVRRASSAFGYQARAQEAAVVGNLFALGFGSLAAVGIAHAELTFVPERVEVRKRATPVVSFAPFVGPLSFGVAGKF